MRKILFLIAIMVLCFSSIAFAVNDNPYDDYTRRVQDGVMVKDYVSPFTSMTTDQDNINTIIKNNVTTGTYTQDNTVGVVLKGYAQSGVSVAGNSEITGASVWLLNDATQTGGTKSSVLSCHVHSDTSTTPDFGIRFFGDVTEDLLQFAESSAADGIDLSLATISGNDIVLNQQSTESVIKKVVDGSGTDVTAGTVIKSYMNDTAVSIGGNSEFVGLGVFGKQLATLGGGSKSALISAHQHEDSTVNFDRGLALFGDVTSALYISGANTNFLECPNTSSAGFTTGELSTNAAADVDCDGSLKILINGTAYYIPLYDTKK